MGDFKGSHFTIRVQGPLPTPYDMRAVGEVENEGAGARLEVRIAQHPLGVGLRRCEGVFLVLIGVGALLAALRQPVFLVFAVFIALGGGALMWTQRPRREDASSLRELIDGAMGDSFSQ